ncbi:hypothetical protein [Bradyrhizobium sp. dw_78]|nr:hypothetical protein [Bradyrhizobium sp. dw_78]
MACIGAPEAFRTNQLLALVSRIALFLFKVSRGIAGQGRSSAPAGNLQVI